MPSNVCIPKYLPGSEVTVVNDSGSTIAGKRCVQIVGVHANGNIQVKLADAGEKIDGVLKWDLVDDNGATKGAIHSEGYLPIHSGAAVTAGAEVEVDATGRVIDLATGVAIGRACNAAGAAAADVIVRLY